MASPKGILKSLFGRRRPPGAEARFKEGNTLAGAGRYEEAIRCYDLALEIDPRYAAAMTNKGDSLYSLGRHEEAVRCFEQVLAMDPRSTYVWYNKALSEEILGLRADAARSYWQFIADDGDQDDPRIAHAWQRMLELGGGRSAGV